MGRETRALLCDAQDAERLRQEETRGQDLEIVGLEPESPSPLVDVVRHRWPALQKLVCDTAGLDVDWDARLHQLRRKLLAQRIACSRVSVSRALARLSAAGRVRLDGRRILLLGHQGRGAAD